MEWISPQPSPAPVRSWILLDVNQGPVRGGVGLDWGSSQCAGEGIEHL